MLMAFYVPPTVAEISNRTSEGIWPLAVKNLIGPKHDNHLFGADVCNVVRPTGHGFDDLAFVARGDQLMGLPRAHVAELEARNAFDQQKFLGFRVMVVPATGNAGMRIEE